MYVKMNPIISHNQNDLTIINEEEI